MITFIYVMFVNPNLILKSPWWFSGTAVLSGIEVVVEGFLLVKHFLA